MGSTKQDCDGRETVHLYWTKKQQPIARLSYVTKKVIKSDKLQQYHTVKREQIDNGIREPGPVKPAGETVHYIPHHPVMREGAKSTKLHI